MLNNARLCCLLSAALFVGMFSCNNDSQPVEPAAKIVVNPNDSTVKGTLTLTERPTDWKQAEGGSYSNMYIRVGSDGVPAAVDSSDLLSAFMATECRGVASPARNSDGTWYFDISVNAPDSSGSASSKAVELRYYSAVEKGTFTAQAIDYQGDAIIGVYERFVPDWK